VALGYNFGAANTAAERRTLMGRQVLLSTSALLTTLALGGCSVNNSGSTTNECRALTATAAQRPAGWGGSVFVIVMENHDHSQIVRSPFAPYINGTLLKMGVDAAGRLLHGTPEQAWTL